VVAHARRRYLPVVVSCVVVLTAGLLAWLLYQPPALYRVTVLPKFRLRLVTPHGLNDRGQIVGYCDGRLLLWERSAGWRELGRTSRSDYPVYPEYLGINNAGQIAGTIHEPNDVSRAFLWDPNEGLIRLGTLGTGTSVARALNSRGEVVGQCGNASGTGQVFLWSKGQGMRAVPEGDGFVMSINDAGQVVTRRDTGTLLQDVLWEPAEDASMTKTLLPSGTFCDLNNYGYVLGSGFNSDKRKHYAFIWRQDRGVEWLFPLRNERAHVVALNDANQVAVCEEASSGWLQRLMKWQFGPTRQSFVWTPGRGQVFLDGYVANRRSEYLTICDMNNHGCIVGVVGLPGRSQGARVVLLEPIPERWGR